MTTASTKSESLQGTTSFSSDNLRGNRRSGGDSRRAPRPGNRTLVLTKLDFGKGKRIDLGSLIERLEVAKPGGDEALADTPR